jgi:hypothetical protein
MWEVPSRTWPPLVWLTIPFYTHNITISTTNHTATVRIFYLPLILCQYSNRNLNLSDVTQGGFLEVQTAQLFMPEVALKSLVFVVLDHLCNSPNPSAALRVTLWKHSPSDPSTGARITCNCIVIRANSLSLWFLGNQTFAKSYTLVIRSLPVDANYLDPVSPLITGVKNDNIPVKILHLSEKSPHRSSLILVVQLGTFSY